MATLIGTLMHWFQSKLIIAVDRAEQKQWLQSKLNYQNPYVDALCFMHDSMSHIWQEILLCRLCP